ncbi:hypothetical protein PYW07_012139 [Mythimna separata]|uniref:2Fe-2S ferredoxin-type domain-containing protein n=1 Tax=Mythimna separata TaxID=271217 RepID=A0AAD7YKN4_MYTSE|nr:hypothetical protein PYW07_012139 [Mythimna separata]
MYCVPKFFLILCTLIKAIDLKIDGLPNLGDKWSYEYQILKSGANDRPNQRAQNNSQEKKDVVARRDIEVFNPEDIKDAYESEKEKAHQKHEETAHDIKNTIARQREQEIAHHREKIARQFDHEFEKKPPISSEETPIDTEQPPRSTKKPPKMTKKLRITTKKTPKPEKVTTTTIKTGDIFTDVHHVGNISKLIENAYRELNITISLLEDFKKLASSLQMKEAFDKAIKIYQQRFNASIIEWKNQQIKTKLGTQKVVLNTIDTSNHLFKSLLNFMIDDFDRKGILRHNVDIVNRFQKAFKLLEKRQALCACRDFGICRQRPEFSAFLTDIMSILLKLDDTKFKQSIDAFTEVVKYMKSHSLLGKDTEKILKVLIERVEQEHIIVLRAMVMILKNTIKSQNKPMIVNNYVARSNVVNSTLAFLQIIDMLDTHIPRNESNASKWADMKKSFEEFAKGERKDVLGIMKEMFRYVTRSLKALDKESLKILSRNVAMILSNTTVMSKIEFTVNGKICTVDESTPRETTLNAYLRYVLALSGTKSMCHEGGCGSCIVMVRARRFPSGVVETFSVNSCLVLVFSCNGWEVTTIEGVGNRLDGYSDVQKRLAAFNGTQCGYCTPGWVMQLTSLLDKNLTMAELEKSFGSNTCRCTGFRPILETIKSFAIDASPEVCQKVTDIEDCNKMSKNPRCCQRQCSINSDCGDWTVVTDVKSESTLSFNFGKYKFFKVYEVDAIFDIFNEHGVDSYMLVDGNTGKGIVDTFDYPRDLIDISDVSSLKTCKFDQNMILGANMSLEECIRIFKEAAVNENGFAYLGEFVKHLELIAHVSVRNIMPRSQNSLALVHSAYLLKIGKRNEIESASIVYGNINPNVYHASETEKFLIGKNIFNDKNLQEAIKVLSRELIPVEIPGEPPIQFRKKLALGLFYKFILNISPAGTALSKYASGGELLKRPVSSGKEDYQTDSSLYPLNQPVDKLEALIQASGEAKYANDLPPYPGEVFGAFVLSKVHIGEVDTMDIEEVMAIEGVLALYTAKDIPGVNSFIYPGVLQMQTHEEEILATKIKFYGQPIAIVVAVTEKLAEEVAKLVKVTYKNVSRVAPVLTIDEAKKDSNRYIPGNYSIEPTGRGDNITKIINGVYEVKSQYHYFIETLSCVVVPVDKTLEVYDATQWMDLTQNVIARSLGIKESEVVVKVRRIGGGFGGKISRSGQVATACALVAKKLDRACRFILPMQTNMAMGGKRQPCQCEYEVGVNDDGEIQYLNASIIQDNGCSNNETILEFLLHNFPNGYDTKYWSVKTATVTTDTPSNSLIRAPGHLEGKACIEHIMQHIAFTVQKDPTSVRKVNMRTEDNDLPELIDVLKNDANYDQRAKEIEQFNKTNRWMKKAISINVMCYQVAYFGNYSALVSIYRGDGTVTVSTGGIEMGQGINTKAAQVCAYELGVPLDYVNIVPNYSFVAANNVLSGSSITTESVCYSIIRACEVLKERLAPIKESMPGATWKEIVQKAGEDQVDLTSLFMMKDTDENLKGYSAFGVCIIETQLDVTTGLFQIARVDMLEDVGTSANPKLDVGQMQGAYIMGLGYHTCEKLILDKETGKLLNNRSLTYHVPLALDIPVEFNVKLRYNSKNINGVLGAKACGEMGICMSHGVTHALRQCIVESRKDSGYDPNEWINIRNKATPYVKMENFILTPDSESPDSTDQEMSSSQKNPSKSVWFTPKSRHTAGMHFLKNRRINFDLPEDEEKATD